MRSKTATQHLISACISMDLAVLQQQEDSLQSRIRPVLALQVKPGKGCSHGARAGYSRQPRQLALALYIVAKRRSLWRQSSLTLQLVSSAGARRMLCSFWHFAGWRLVDRANHSQFVANPQRRTAAWYLRFSLRANTRSLTLIATKCLGQH